MPNATSLDRDSEGSGSWLAGIVQGSNDAIIGESLDGIITSWNPSAERVFGYTAAELIGQPIAVLVPLELGDEQAQMLQRLQTGEYVDHFETMRVRKNGALIDVALTISPICDQSGTIIGLSKVVRDITHVKKNRDALLRQARLLDQAYEAILVRDDDDRITYWNSGAERVYGWTSREADGRVSHELLRTLFPQPLEDIRMTLLTVGHWQGELIHTNRDGQKITVLSHWVREAGERAAYVLETNFDLTERNRALALERANQLKSEFLASVSHELRSPLHTIIGFSELLAEQAVGPLNVKQHRFVNHIHKDSLHLLNLINDLLDLSKIEAGKLPLHREAFDSCEVVQEAINTVAVAAEAKSIRIDMLPSLSLTVYADRLRVHQILVNLISNAVKFTPAGGGVRIECNEEDQFARFSVVDTGIGIPKEDQQAIFDKFHQVGSGAKEAREGTGLGLAITKHLVNQHGGTIRVESEFGHGSQFIFTLPLKALAAGAAL